MQAATLETLVNLVAAGYGSTLIPALAAGSLARVGYYPCAAGPGKSAGRSGWPAAQGFRAQALRAIEKVIRKAVRFPAVPKTDFPSR